MESSKINPSPLEKDQRSILPFQWGQREGRGADFPRFGHERGLDQYSQLAPGTSLQVSFQRVACIGNISHYSRAMSPVWERCARDKLLARIVMIMFNLFQSDAARAEGQHDDRSERAGCDDGSAGEIFTRFKWGWLEKFWKQIPKCFSILKNTFGGLFFRYKAVLLVTYWNLGLMWFAWSIFENSQSCKPGK